MPSLRLDALGGQDPATVGTARRHHLDLVANLAAEQRLGQRRARRDPSVVQGRLGGMDDEEAFHTAILVLHGHRLAQFDQGRVVGEVFGDGGVVHQPVQAAQLAGRSLVVGGALAVRPAVIEVEAQLREQVGAQTLSSLGQQSPALAGQDRRGASVAVQCLHPVELHDGLLSLRRTMTVASEHVVPPLAKASK